MWLKIAYSLFTAVMSFTYLFNYGATNFLYFCDQAVLLTFAGIWLEDPLLISLCTVGILGPQILWVVDFVATVLGHPLTGMTAYMVDTDRSFFLRALSSFNGWLPFLLIYLVHQLGYDRRALPIWTAMSAATLLVCFFFMPGPRPNPGLTPVNINYVHGLSDNVAQTWVPPSVWLTGLIVGLPILLYAPTHWLLRRFMPAAEKTGRRRSATGTLQPA